jgi:hypothetical protein
MPAICGYYLDYSNYVCALMPYLAYDESRGSLHHWIPLSKRHWDYTFFRTSPNWRFGDFGSKLCGRTLAWVSVPYLIESMYNDIQQWSDSQPPSIEWMSSIVRIFDQPSNGEPFNQFPRITRCAVLWDLTRDPLLRLVLPALAAFADKYIHSPFVGSTNDPFVNRASMYTLIDSKVIHEDDGRFHLVPASFLRSTITYEERRLVWSVIMRGAKSVAKELANRDRTRIFHLLSSMPIEWLKPDDVNWVFAGCQLNDLLERDSEPPLLPKRSFAAFQDCAARKKARVE